MRKIALLLAALFVIGIGLLCMAETLGVGSHTYSVSFVSASGAPIQKVRCWAFDPPEDSIEGLERGELEWHEPRPVVADPFTGQNLSVSATFTTRGAVLPWRREHHQETHLMTEVEYKGGKHIRKVVRLPDGRRTRSLLVSVP